MYSRYIYVIGICLLLLLMVLQGSSKVEQGKTQMSSVFETETVSADSSKQQKNVSKVSSVELDTNKAGEIGSVYEAFLSPQQEPGEEENTPALTPKAFKSTAPSTPRNQRKSLGHAVIRFTKDLSKAYVDVKVQGVNVQDIVMFHIHCGKPDMLGPILVDFAFSGDIQGNLSDGVFSVELTNEDIEKVISSKHSHGVVAAFTLGCPIVPGGSDKVKTIAGMEHIARRSELYFNLHTKGQVYFGDMRGQIHPVRN